MAKIFLTGLEHSRKHPKGYMYQHHTEVASSPGHSQFFNVLGRGYTVDHSKVCMQMDYLEAGWSAQGNTLRATSTKICS